MTMDFRNINIHLDGTRLDPSAKPPPPVTSGQWEQSVERTLFKIGTSDIGLLLLRHIHRSGKWVQIEPYWSKLDPDWSRKCNASTLVNRTWVADDWYASKQRWYYSRVLFSPDRFDHGSPCAERRRREGGATSEPHETLFHELVHALRQVWRTRWTDVKLGGGLADQTDVEEFIAVLVTNIYASANGKKILRAGHSGHKSLDKSFADSFGFFQLSSMTVPLVEYFCAANKEFCDDLAKLDACFHPIRAFKQDPDKARRYAHNAKARSRDGPLITFLADFAEAFF
jgi:hypothetical protein